MEQLIQEAVVTVPRALIAETIDLVAVLSGRGSARRLSELARVEGLGPDGDYRVTPAVTALAVEGDGGATSLTPSPEGENL
jgi:type IV secretion system protein VirB11